MSICFLPTEPKKKIHILHHLFLMAQLAKGVRGRGKLTHTLELVQYNFNLLQIAHKSHWFECSSYGAIIHSKMKQHIEMKQLQQGNNKIGIRVPLNLYKYIGF